MIGQATNTIQLLLVPVICSFLSGVILTYLLMMYLLKREEKAKKQMSSKWTRSITCKDCGNIVILETNDAYTAPVGKCEECGAEYVENWTVTYGYVITKISPKAKEG